MGSLLVAYVGGWLAISAYVGWISRQNAKLARRMEELEALLEEGRRKDEFPSKAA
jgi:hypothetical protein